MTTLKPLRYIAGIKLKLRAIKRKAERDGLLHQPGRESEEREDRARDGGCCARVWGLRRGRGRMRCRCRRRRVCRGRGGRGMSSLPPRPHLSSCAAVCCVILSCVCCLSCPATCAGTVARHGPSTCHLSPGWGQHQRWCSGVQCACLCCALGGCAGVCEWGHSWLHRLWA